MSAVVVAQVIPEIPWGALAPELILFGAGILVLLLDTAGETRTRASVGVAVIALAAGGGLVYELGQTVVGGLVGLAGLAQLALTILWRDRPRALGAILAWLGFAGALGASVALWLRYAGGPVLATDEFLGQMVAVDGVALFTRFTICVVGLAAIPLGFSYLEDRRIHRGEYYPLMMFAATGMVLLASAGDFLMVFVAIEVLSLALYVMVAFAKRDLRSQESAFKYFLLGAFSSALLLYGIALVYGATGTTNIAAAGRLLSTVGVPAGLGTAGIALMLVGFGFKTALVPFHMWTPDAYQGAPTPVTAFMAAATKAAAFAAFLRVFVGALAPLQWTWQPVVWVLAAVTMIVGAVLAVVQDDVKRMLGYSAVAHAGYALVGLLPATRDGVGATLFYLLVYAVMALGAFGVLGVLERRGRKAMSIADLRGLGRGDAGAAFMLSVFLLSLAGIPGTAGFMAKLAVFRATVEAGLARGDTWLVAIVVVAVVSSMIAFFFYVRVIVAMFMEPEPDHLVGVPVPASAGASAGLVAATVAVVAVGILPGVLVDLARQAASFAG